MNLPPTAPERGGLSSAPKSPRAGGHRGCLLGRGGARPGEATKLGEKPRAGSAGLVWLHRPCIAATNLVARKFRNHRDKLSVGAGGVWLELHLPHVAVLNCWGKSPSRQPSGILENDCMGDAGLLNHPLPQPQLAGHQNIPDSKTASYMPHHRHQCSPTLAGCTKALDAPFL